jgi:hypothetical protein
VPRGSGSNPIELTCRAARSRRAVPSCPPTRSASRPAGGLRAGVRPGPEPSNNDIICYGSAAKPNLPEYAPANRFSAVIQLKYATQFQIAVRSIKVPHRIHLVSRCLVLETASTSSTCIALDAVQHKPRRPSPLQISSCTRYARESTPIAQYTLLFNCHNSCVRRAANGTRVALATRVMDRTAPCSSITSTMILPHIVSFTDYSKLRGSLRVLTVTAR